jgi:flavin reductase (DIM6/NTAB) family NADH-FMN oxidoreductase RutF
MIDSDTFRAALGRFSCGITILTARDHKGRDHGMTVSAFCSVSLEPPMVLVCIGHDASMHNLMMRVEHVGISVLSSAQEALSRRFADPESDRFDGVGYSRGENGVALLDDALVHLECDVVARHEAGDHTIVVCAVERAEALEGRPLLYYRGGYAQLER